MNGGTGNTGIGHQAQRSITSGTSNVGVGSDAQRMLTTGVANVAAGLSAGYNITTGGQNTAVGNNSLAQPKNLPANATTTASYQTAVGSQSGAHAAATGNKLTAVGYQSVAHTEATALGAQTEARGIRSTAIGYGAIADLANQIMLGTATERVYVNNDPVAALEVATKGYVDAKPAGGTTIITGSVPPTPADGADGYYYLDTAAHILYGPKSGTAWPVAVQDQRVNTYPGLWRAVFPYSAFTTAPLNAGYGRITRMILPQAFSEVQIEVTVVAATTFQVGVYEDTATGPGALLASSGVIDASGTVGNRTAPLAVPEGPSWLLVQNTGGATATIRAVNGMNPYSPGHDTIAANSFSGSWWNTGLGTSLPNPWKTAAQSRNAQSPAVFLRAPLAAAARPV